MLSRGARLVEVLKQGQYVPQDVARQVVILFAATNGYIDAIPSDKIADYESSLHSFVMNSHPDLYDDIRRERALSDDIKASLASVLTEFKEVFAG
jgi:F-type H+-transporting ATPase subunit alpha